ncbi:tRNA lysidine(34) synthetase TilS [Halobacillus salinarum]|uniref:tRNA(Ile)-lysidine synthase n=1 Tax=Halobacillus salinarum TaxID=2932257 RepID=A0ABY4EKH3_9BACI|nr:tRNA lysidine(34) synthetase TilS [Halobacillus salinarum]UOQ44659.1 tRNA lysidine(34) synthetase TilS [Halobacillus salinarum]
MIHNVDSFVEKHQLIQPKSTVVVAVSGGPDSMALLHYFLQKKEQWQLSIIAASVDHGLRGEHSLADLNYVKKTAEQWNINFFGTSVDVQSYKQQQGVGTQEAARVLRYQYFHQVMTEVNADVLAFAHHGDDQAETLFMQMVRSARPEAVQGMPIKRPFGTGSIIRPFLCVAKQELLHYCEQHQIGFKLDASNEETNYTRNAFRKHIMPLLKEQNPKIHLHMQAMSERVRDDYSYITKQAEEVLKPMRFSSEKGKRVEFSISTFKSHPPALQRSAFHLILNYLYDNQTEDISYLHEEMFMNLLKEQKPNAELDLPHELKVVRAYDELTFSFHSSEDICPYSHLIDIGERLELKDGHVLTLEQCPARSDENRYEFICDSHHVKLPLIVRSRKQGDRMKLRGMNGSKKVKDIFIDKKIPAQLRKSWPLVTDSDGRILWVIGLKKGEGCAGEGSGTWLRLRYTKKEDT